MSGTMSPSTGLTYFPTVLSWSPSPVICITNSSVQQYVASLRPNITQIYQSRGGDAAGGEVVWLYGHHLGTNSSQIGVAMHDSSIWKVCKSAKWMESMTYDPTYGSVNKMTPYIECVTASTTVGQKNVTLFVDSQISLPYLFYEVSCKAGYYGGIGEMCISCNGDNNSSSAQSTISSELGLRCPSDNMADPIASPGVFHNLILV